MLVRVSYLEYAMMLGAGKQFFLHLFLLLDEVVNHTNVCTHIDVYFNFTLQRYTFLTKLPNVFRCFCVPFHIYYIYNLITHRFNPLAARDVTPCGILQPSEGIVSIHTHLGE